ncbi:hypothetical protein ZWY2020_010390 [Hordeum vulgare]|nr:hypothetical protein ZWY2020_010390 [Hordeum vulgare]
MFLPGSETRRGLNEASPSSGSRWTSPVKPRLAGAAAPEHAALRASCIRARLPASSGEGSRRRARRSTLGYLLDGGAALLRTKRSAIQCRTSTRLSTAKPGEQRAVQEALLQVVRQVVVAQVQRPRGVVRQPCTDHAGLASTSPHSSVLASRVLSTPATALMARGMHPHLSTSLSPTPFSCLSSAATHADVRSRSQPSALEPLHLVDEAGAHLAGGGAAPRRDQHLPLPPRSSGFCSTSSHTPPYQTSSTTSRNLLFATRHVSIA